MTASRPATLLLRFHLSQQRPTQSVNLPGARSNPPSSSSSSFFMSFMPPLLSLFNTHCILGALQISRLLLFSLSDTWTRSRERNRTKQTTAGNRRSRSIHLSSVYLSSDRGCSLFHSCFLLLVLFLEDMKLKTSVWRFWFETPYRACEKLLLIMLQKRQYSQHLIKSVLLFCNKLDVMHPFFLLCARRCQLWNLGSRGRFPRCWWCQTSGSISWKWHQKPSE